MNINIVNDLREKETHKNSKWIIVSLGFMTRRAHVFKLKNNNYVIKQIEEEIRKFKDNKFPVEWLCVDFITSEEDVQFTELYEELVKTRRNYIDFGISFDSDYNLSLLAKEINANAFVRPKPGKDHNDLYV